MGMNRPTIKGEVAVATTVPDIYFVAFWATPDAASDFARFGQLEPLLDNRYALFVDRRYDFDEVMQYIQSKE